MYQHQPLDVTPDLLLEAMQAERDSAARYSQLQQMAENSEDANLIQEIHTDADIHYNALAALYRQLTGANPPQLAAAGVPLPSYTAAVKESIPAKLQRSEFYRCIALNCHNPATRLFYDLMADENKHAAILSYLYAKAVEENCCCGGTQPVEPPVCDGISHTVQPGESLWGIAQNYAVTVEELLAANGQITDPSTIYTGQLLCIPCSGILYTVQPGDSLWAIAQRHGITVEELTATNPLVTDAGNLQVGQLLCIPCCTGEPGPGPLPTAGRESLTYLYGGTWTYYLNALAETRGSISTVCPDFFGLDDNGGLLLAASNKLNREFIQELHSQGITVTPFLSNHWNRSVGIAALGNRDILTTQLADAVEQYDLDGVNFDIENVSEQYRDAYVDMVRLMRQKLPAGKVVSTAVAANPNGWNVGWHGSYDYPALSDYCDYLVVMAYDESYQGGPAGPVSSHSFFEQSIQYAMNQGVPKEKLIIGIPFFGRYWKQGEETGGIGIAQRDVEYLLQNYPSTAQYDEVAKSAQAVVTIRQGDPLPQIWGGRTLTPGTYTIWYDNLMSTRDKLQTIDRYDLRGAGSWALGQENPAIWEFYTQALNA